MGASQGSDEAWIRAVAGGEGSRVRVHDCREAEGGARLLAHYESCLLPDPRGAGESSRVHVGELSGPPVRLTHAGMRASYY